MKKNSSNVMMRTGLVVLALATTSVLFNNCSKQAGGDAIILESTSSISVNSTGNTSPTGATGTLCEQDLKNLYSRGWHTFLKTNCAICHNAGPGKGRFATNDLNLAFTDFQATGYTKVAANAVNPTHNPPYSGVQHTQITNELKVEWQKGLQDYATCSGTTTAMPTETAAERITLTSTNQTIGLEKEGDSKVLTWDLSSDLTRVKGEAALPSVPGAKFGLKVTRLKNAGGYTYYTFSSPTIYGSSVDIRVQGIFIKMNRFLLNYPSTFSFIDKSIRKGSANDLTGLVSTGSLVAPKVVVPSDFISVSFANITVVDLPPPPPPMAVSVSGANVVVVPKGSQFMEFELALSSPAQEPVVVTVAPSNDFCGTVSNVANSNTLYKAVSTTCLPQVFSTICPTQTCTNVNVITYGWARDPLGTKKENRYDWDYRFPDGSVTFSNGEQFKKIRVYFSRDIRKEKNRVAKFEIAAVLGDITISANKSIHYVIKKYDNPDPTPDVLTFSELMDPSYGILGQNCTTCHNSDLRAGGYDMTDYELMIDRGVLIPGDVNSKMYVRMHPTPEFLAKPMPQNGFLDQTKIWEVERWLLDGAKNN